MRQNDGETDTVFKCVECGTEKTLPGTYRANAEILNICANPACSNQHLKFCRRAEAPESND